MISGWEIFSLTLEADAGITCREWIPEQLPGD